MSTRIWTGQVAADMAFISPNLAKHDIQFQISDDLGSDHLPISGALRSGSSTKVVILIHNENRSLDYFQIQHLHPRQPLTGDLKMHFRFDARIFKAA